MEDENSHRDIRRRPLLERRPGFPPQPAACMRRVSGIPCRHAPRPTCEQVCDGRAGHADVVRMEYDPAIASYEALPHAFWRARDPTQVNRQSPDIGEQYRLAIFTHDADREPAALASRTAVATRLPCLIATAIEPSATTDPPPAATGNSSRNEAWPAPDTPSARPRGGGALQRGSWGRRRRPSRRVTAARPRDSERARYSGPHVCARRHVGDEVRPPCPQAFAMIETCGYHACTYPSMCGGPIRFAN